MTEKIISKVGWSTDKRGNALRCALSIALSEMDHVDWLAPRGEQRFDRLDDGRLAVLEVEGNRSLVAVDVDHFSTRHSSDVLLDRRGVAQGGTGVTRMTVEAPTDEALVDVVIPVGADTRRGPAQL